MSDDNSERKRQRKTSGILRIDVGGKPRRSSGSSVEFRQQPELLGQFSPVSTETVVSPQLSVSWAFPPEDNSDNSRGDNSDDQFMRPAKVTNKKSFFMHDEHILIPKPRNLIKVRGGNTSEHLSKNEKESPIYMEASSPFEIAEHDSEDEDYSLSVSAIMQRRASTKGIRKRGHKTNRRASSPMNHISVSMAADRRRSSVYTTSSGETAISFEDTNQESSQEQIFENIRLHKEVLQSVKMQPWSMRRKLRLVQQAKSYVTRHEDVLQERFASSRSTKDLLTRFRILLATKLQHARRELVNLSTVLIPWESRIKEIESHFGSVVASYFTFLRWLFWVNIVIAIVLTIFVIGPEYLSDLKKPDHRKELTLDEIPNSTDLITLWDLKGVLRISPLFYGYYSYYSGAVNWGYQLPLAYFLTGLVVYIYSFVATLRKMAENSRMSKLSSKDDECVFSWKLFTGWDFMIGHTETAQNRVASVVLGFKEALLEEAEKKKDTRNWKVIVLRIFVNLMVILLLAVSAFAVIFVVNRSLDPANTNSWWGNNEITVVMSLISFFFPMFFEALGLLEYYHPRQQLRLQLARIMLLNLLNLYSLIFALFGKIEEMKEFHTTNQTSRVSTESPINVIPTPLFLIGDYMSEVTRFGDVDFPQILTTESLKHFDLTTSAQENMTRCYEVLVNCTKSDAFNSTILATLLLLGLSSNLSNFSDFTNGSMENDVDATNISFLVLNNSNSEYDFPLAMNFNVSDNQTTDGMISSAEYADDEGVKSTTEEMVTNKSVRTTTEDIYDNYDELYSDEDYLRDSDEQNRQKREFFDNLFDIFSNYTSYNNLTEISNATLLNIINALENITYSNSTWNSTNESLDEFSIQMVEDLINSLPMESEESCYETICEAIYETTEWSPDYSTTEYEALTDATTLTPTSPEDNEEDDSNTTISTARSDSPGATEAYNFTTANINVPVQSDTTTPPNVEVVQKPQESKTKRQKQCEMEQKLPPMCWETMFGQELVKLTIMDTLITIISTLILDFFRAIFVRYMNNCWCWDLEKKYPKYGDFKIAENILHLVNNQGMVWMGMFFSPGLAILNLAKLAVMMYLRSWAVLTCNVPHEVVFRASRSNNFYLALLLTMLFLCVLPVSYAIVWLAPSCQCGPFSEYERIYYLLTDTMEKFLPSVFFLFKYIASPAAIIPLLLLLILIIYYLISLTSSLREANQDLKIQLRKERTEERKKMMKLVVNQPAPATTAISARWKKVMEGSQTATPNSTPIENDEACKVQNRKDMLACIMKKALRKSSATSDDDSINMPPMYDDGTDSEQHESLPHDQNSQMKKIVKRVRTKTDQTAANHTESAAKPKDILNHHPKSKFKVTTVNETKPDYDLDNEEEEKIRVVAERRSSLLRKQNEVNAKKKDENAVSSDQSAQNKIRDKKAEIVRKMLNNKKSKEANEPIYAVSSKQRAQDNTKAVAVAAADEPKRNKNAALIAVAKDAVQAHKIAETDEASPQAHADAADKNKLRKERKPKVSLPKETGKNFKRKDSISSIWSDNIPVIKISKTESDECILESYKVENKHDDAPPDMVATTSAAGDNIQPPGQPSGAGTNAADGDGDEDRDDDDDDAAADIEPQQRRRRERQQE